MSIYLTHCSVLVLILSLENYDFDAARGEVLQIKLYMEAQNFPMVPSQNVVAEWTGSLYPNEVVIVSGHLDSWDVGQGAMDDGGGAVTSWQVLSALRQLNLRPRRTIRLVMWTCEEFGNRRVVVFFLVNNYYFII